MKTPNSVAQKIRILHKTNKKKYFSYRMPAFWKPCSCICTEYLAGPPCGMNFWHRGNHKAWQQNEAQSAQKFPGTRLRWLKHSGSTPADSVTPQIITNHETFHWISVWILYLSSLPPPWTLIFHMKCKFYFHLPLSWQSASSFSPYGTWKYQSTSCPLLLTSFMETLVSFSSRT